MDARWSAALTGEPGDLRYFAQAIGDGPVWISEQPDGSFEMSSLRFENLSTAGEVRTAAEEIALALSGVAKASIQSRSPFRVGAIFERGVSGGRSITLQVDSAVHAQRSSPVILIHKRADGSEVLDPETRAVSERLSAALVHREAMRALRLLAKGDETWVDLYRVLEVVEANVPSDVLNTWVGKSQLRRFKHTANSVAIAGDGARHGSESKSRPKNPFRLSEARGFVHGIVERWLDYLRLAGPTSPDGG